MKILVTGRGGQLGHELMKSLTPLGSLVGIDVSECDLTQSAAIEALLDRVKPDVIVNSAAYTEVDKAESEPTIAHAVNVQAPKLMARYASRRNIPMIHFSTDYVFYGLKDGAYHEEDEVNPLSVYGKTKWLGEEAVRKMAAKHVIIRTSWVFGVHGVNFLKTVLKVADERDKLTAVSDQVGSPTSARLLAVVTAEVIRQLHEPGSYRKYGTYHLSSAGEVSWFEYAQFVVDEANQLGAHTRLSSSKILPVSTKEYPLIARRPLNSILDSTKIQTTFAISTPCWREQVREVLTEILS